jgi:lysophospholipase L1-like esterase
MLIEPNSKLLMIGDSITDCGRAFPIGETINDGLGNGYASLVNALLAVTYPGHYIRTLNMGISGNTVNDLEMRWESDVLGLKPDWLSVLIGINDVWRHFDPISQTEELISQEKYAQVLERLVSKTRPQLKGLILMAPYFIEPNKLDPMRVMMDDYGAVVRQLAGTYQAIFVDTQAAFDVAMKEIPPDSLALDRVHLNQLGHMILARAFLIAIGFEWGLPE